MHGPGEGEDQSLGSGGQKESNGSSPSDQNHSKIKQLLSFGHPCPGVHNRKESQEKQQGTEYESIYLYGTTLSLPVNSHLYTETQGH